MHPPAGACRAGDRGQWTRARGGECRPGLHRRTSRRRHRAACHSVGRSVFGREGIDEVFRAARCGAEQNLTRIQEVLQSELRYKVAIRFAIQNDVRFISHHDTMRMFERALARTDLPVRFSEGFNPRPKLSLPLPRPVGIATTMDVLVVEFVQPVEPEEVMRQLAAQMPLGVALGEAWVPPGRRPMQPESVTYTLQVAAEQVPRLSEQVQGVLHAATWPIQRVRDDAGPAKTLDLRAYLLDAHLAGDSLFWTVRVTGGGSIRPAEFLAAVGLDPNQWQHRVCRTAIAWQTPAEDVGSAEST